MKKTALILSASMVLFTTVYSSAWCMCMPTGTDPVKTACTACYDPGTDMPGCADEDSEHHCTRYENTAEAVPNTPVLYTVPLASAPVPLSVISTVQKPCILPASAAVTNRDCLRTRSLIALLI